MKKLTYLSLILFSCLNLAACGGDESKSTSSGSSGTALDRCIEQAISGGATSTEAAACYHLVPGYNSGSSSGSSSGSGLIDGLAKSAYDCSGAYSTSLGGYFELYGVFNSELVGSVSENNTEAGCGIHS